MYRCTAETSRGDSLSRTKDAASPETCGREDSDQSLSDNCVAKPLNNCKNIRNKPAALTFKAHVVYARYSTGIVFVLWEQMIYNVIVHKVKRSTASLLVILISALLKLKTSLALLREVISFWIPMHIAQCFLCTVQTTGLTDNFFYQKCLHPRGPICASHRPAGTTSSFYVCVLQSGDDHSSGDSAPFSSCSQNSMSHVWCKCALGTFVVLWIVLWNILFTRKFNKTR